MDQNKLNEKDIALSLMECINWIDARKSPWISFYSGYRNILVMTYLGESVAEHGDYLIIDFMEMTVMIYCIKMMKRNL